MQYVAAAAGAPRPGAPTTGIDDAVDQPAPFNRPPAFSPPQLPLLAAPRKIQGTYWSLLSPSGALLPITNPSYQPPRAMADIQPGPAPAPTPDVPLSANNVARSIATGIPITGGLANQGNAGDALDPARTRRLLERAKRDYDFVRRLSGASGVHPAQPMKYVAPAADAPHPGAPATGIDDAVDQPAPFNQPPASSPPQLPLFAAPRGPQGTYWSLISPSGALLPAGDLGAVNNPPATATWPRVSNSHVSMAGHPVNAPAPPPAPVKPSPPIAALEDAGLPQPTASPSAPPPIADDRSGWPSARPAWSAPPRSQYWQAQHGIDIGPVPMDRATALARTENTRRLASEGWEAGYGDQPIIPYEWRQTYNSTAPVANTLWNAGTVLPWTADKVARTARGAYLGAIGGLAGMAGDSGVASHPDDLAQALPEMINVIGAATAQPELSMLPRFPASTAVRFAAKYPGEPVAGVAEPYLFNRPMDWAISKAVPQDSVGAFGGRLVPPRPAREAGLTPEDLRAGQSTRGTAPAPTPSWLTPSDVPLLPTPEPRLPPLQVPPAPPANATRISSRFPTAVTATEDPLTHQLGIGLREFEMSPTFDFNTGLFANYPGFARLHAMPPADAARAAIEQMRGNLNALWEQAPPVIQQRSSRWYEGANRISNALAERWGVPRQSVSGAIAATSPQKDWFQNASLAERIGDTLFGPAASQTFTPEMAQRAASIPAMQIPVAQDTLRRISGKSLDQISDPADAAVWMRLYDETHNPRGYRTITPEGDFGAPVLNRNGRPSRIAWGSNDAVAKAITSLRSGGDLNAISGAMGGANKVRSFYNNIELPWERRFGDVTADTQQVAAGQLRPLSGNTPAVAHNFGANLEQRFRPPDWVAARSSSLDGIRGTYPLYVEATRGMAADQGLLPRAGQSPGWEAVRELFPNVFKNAKNGQAIDAIWRAYDRGEITLDDARRRIFDYAAPGGIGAPSWAQSSAPVADPRWSSSYR